MLARLVAALAAGEMSGAVRRLRVVTALYALAALLALFGASFLLLAAFVSAAARWGVTSTALGFGAGFLVLALAVVVGLKIWQGVQARRVHRRRVSDAGVLAGTAALTLLPSLLARSGGLGTLILPLVAVAGYAIYRENAGPGDKDDS